MYRNTKSFVIIIVFLISSCATYRPQYENADYDQSLPIKEIERTFYLIGNAGYVANDESTLGLEGLKQIITEEDTADDYLIYLGDNIGKKKMTSQKSKETALAEYRINVQVAAAENFDGNVVFIPGNHDWKNNGLKGLKRQEKYIRNKLKSKKSFLPAKGCPIESIEVSNQIQLIIIDTQWYLADWNKHPKINDDCEIKTRAIFFSEIEGEFKKHNGKSIIVAMHHPMFTNGIHGGKSSFRNHIFPSKSILPLPFLGSLCAQIRSQGGISSQDRYNVNYNKLMNRLSIAARDNDRIIFASAHDYSLQYINNKGLKQVVSGAGSKVAPASLGSYGLFSYPSQGFAALDIYSDGSSNVRFYGIENSKAKLVYQTEVHKAPEVYNTSGLKSAFKAEKSVSIYEKSETEKSSFFKSLWGDHYRDVYSTKLTLPVATLDTLLGGFTIERQGGGQVTRSLRLITKEGKRYSLRAMRKSVTQFLQKGAFKDTYLEDGFEDTFTEELLADFYTSSYPYAFLAVGGLADAIGVYHANPQLVYIPKHSSLGDYNKTFGDEMYFLEERPGKEHKELLSFGNSDDIEGTDDVLKNLRKDEKYQMDEAHYIRTRLFDMILGDWDRHEDQWRWSRFDQDDKSIYRPIPKDRDQVFCNYDGSLLNLIKAIVPVTRKFGVYGKEQKNVRWINEAGIRLDRTFAQKSGQNIWLEEAKYIQENLTDVAIDRAFENLPNELQGAVVDSIKKSVRTRRDNIVSIAYKYYTYVSKQVIIRGTDKDDLFQIIRGDNQTTITISRIKGKQRQEPYYKRILYSKETKEIWIYGLDDDDQFEIKEKGNNPINIRIVGGQNNDVYKIENGRKVRVYDHKNKPNTIQQKSGAKFILTNDYNTNIYDSKKNISRTNTFIPLIGFNPDDGLNVNVTDTYVVKGFNNDPYQSKHIFNAAYYVATRGYDISYKGEFANTIGNLNLLVGGTYTSENFAQNFFGYGNNTTNFDDNLGLDYNRVKTGLWGFNLGLLKKGRFGSEFTVTGSFESIEVQDSENRFITSGLPTVNDDPIFFERKFFVGLDLDYEYKNFDNAANPTRGMFFSLQGGSKASAIKSDKIYGYAYTKLGFYNALSKNRKLVLKTGVQAQHLLGNGFEFYQAAKLGGNNGLRGFREERFTGRSSVAFSTDLRYSFNKFKTGILPLQLGLFSGYDYGRVWFDGENSNRWHDSIGGGLWINAIDAIAGQIGVFSSDDGVRFSFGLEVSF